MYKPFSAPVVNLLHGPLTYDHARVLLIALNLYQEVKVGSENLQASFLGLKEATRQFSEVTFTSCGVYSHTTAGLLFLIFAEIVLTLREPYSSLQRLEKLSSCSFEFGAVRLFTCVAQPVGLVWLRMFRFCGLNFHV